MIFTRRFLWLVAAGALPLAIAFLWPSGALLAVLWNFVLFALALVDYLSCPRPENAVTLERIHDEALSVGAANEITLRVRSQSNRPLTILLRDEPPADFVISEGARQQVLRLAPGDAQTLSYAVTPPRRGDFTFGDVYARTTGPSGLVIRQARLPAAQAVSVYPDLKAVADYELMLRRAHLSRQGTRRVRVIGAGREFANLREYSRDDEYRSIDWKATARRGKVMSRTYESERSQDVLLLIDQGRLMRQEIQQTQKLDCVVNAALMLAHVVAAADDRIGLLTFANETRAWLQPRRGRAQANEVLQALYAARAEPIESDYRSAFRFLSARWRKRSLAVLFTDLADPESSGMLLAEIAQLAAMHLVVCVVIRDPLVSERARRMPEDVPQVYEKAVADEVLSERRRALNLLKKRGVLIVDAEPQELSVELVARYLDVKSRSLL